MKKSFSLIEVVLACTVLILFLTAGLILIVGAGRGVVTSRHRTQAIYLANDGIEYVRAARDATFFGTPELSLMFLDGFATSIDDKCYSQDLADVPCGGHFFRRDAEIINGFDGTDQTKKLKVTISWTDFSQSKEVILYTYFSNWQK